MGLDYRHEDTVDYERRKVLVGLIIPYICKALSRIGVDKPRFVVHHKEHITKVMDHATVGYLLVCR